MDTALLPFAVPFGTRVKFTVLGAADSVSDSASVAFRATVEGPEFSCARAAGEANIAKAMTASPIRAFRISLIMPPRQKGLKNSGCIPGGYHRWAMQPGRGHVQLYRIGAVFQDGTAVPKNRKGYYTT